MEVRWDSNDVVGEGGFARVYNATLHRPDGARSQVVVKVFHRIREDRECRTYFEREKENLRLLVRHVGEINRPRLTVFVASGEDALVMLNHGQSLRDTVIGLESDLMQIRVDVATAIRFLHDNGYCHRDIKADNVVVSQLHCKVVGNVI
ncbi:hypothetical protein HDV00_004742 [Rhizophlyctis rosea]|nr:hypothetical protein HDV00_004742 [Rhizophlyctis rosea]